MVIVDMFLITLIVVFIVDYSGFMDSVKLGLTGLLKSRSGNKVLTTMDMFKMALGSKLLDKETKRIERLKPFDCSLCSTFWVLLLFLLFTSSFTLGNLVIVCGMSFITKHISEMMVIIDELLIKMLRNIC